MTTKQKLSPAMRRYLARFMPTMATYIVVLLTCVFAIDSWSPTGPLLWLLAVAPALPMVGIIVVMGLYLVEETDEFQRTILVQSLLWGIGITLGAASIWGFLENEHLVPHAPSFLWFPFFCGAMGLAQPFIRWRYR
jgi:hypothetical protein